LCGHGGVDQFGQHQHNHDSKYKDAEQVVLGQWSLDVLSTIDKGWTECVQLLGKEMMTLSLLHMGVAVVGKWVAIYNLA
jgi:hypothetical protein